MSSQPTSGTKVLIDGEWCVELSAEFLCAMVYFPLTAPKPESKLSKPYGPGVTAGKQGTPK